MHELIHAIEHSLLDCLKTLPFLFLTVLILEIIEHRAADRFVASMRRAGRFGPLLGAGLGCVPQCGFSAACAELFNGGLVSAGTLVAVFLSTSDEAIPILLSNPGGLLEVLKLLGAKLLIAIIAGFVLDAIWSREKQQLSFIENNEPHVCKSDEKFIHIVLAALRRALGIFLFLFIITLALSLLIEYFGEERLAALLLPGPFQPLIAGVIGLIPNCAVSVLLTELYLDGMLTAGALLAGLLPGAGVGTLVLLRTNKRPKENLSILGLLVAVGFVFGLIFDLFGICPPLA